MLCFLCSRCFAKIRLTELQTEVRKCYEVVTFHQVFRANLYINLLQRSLIPTAPAPLLKLILIMFAQFENVSLSFLPL